MLLFYTIVIQSPISPRNTSFPIQKQRAYIIYLWIALHKIDLKKNERDWPQHKHLQHMYKHTITPAHTHTHTQCTTLNIPSNMHPCAIFALKVDNDCSKHQLKTDEQKNEHFLSRKKNMFFLLSGRSPAYLTSQRVFKILQFLMFLISVWISSSQFVSLILSHLSPLLLLR